MRTGKRTNRILEDRHAITIDGHEVAVTVKRHPRARRMILRLDRTGEGAVVTIPADADPADGVDMARRQSAWLRDRLQGAGRRVVFADGARIPYRGRDHAVRHRPEARGTVWLEDGEIHVAGAGEHLPRRLGDWLRKQARAEIGGLVHAKAAALGKTPGRITIRDTRSRWGSCSATGGLSFSWRLIMAPPPVLAYVVAHEVAHLAHMNHGPAFWAAVDGLGVDRADAQAWLKRHGGDLHRVG